MAQGKFSLDLQFACVLTRLQTEFYSVNTVKVNGKIHANVFSTASVEENRAMKRPIAKLYTSGVVLSMEPLIDAGIREFCEQIEQSFIQGDMNSKEKKICDLTKWLNFCTAYFLYAQMKKGVLMTVV